jgi:dolichyl-phosphooligosaccharide-protein glycotransferase
LKRRSKRPARANLAGSSFRFACGLTETNCYSEGIQPLFRTLASSITVLIAVIIALAVRVLPAWSAVFPSNGVNFQEGDALFHLRTVHNLLAHFPYRSGFDPYALFPGGQNIPTGPFWDYMIASTSWLLGFGSPSPLFVDQVAAWLPAILGALFPIPAYFLARRFFDATAALFAALWIALLPGGFLWLTHLGLADHHAAEAFFAFVTLALLCAAVEGSGASRVASALVAGVAMGAFLATRPAGIFVPAILACAAAWEPLAAFPILLAASTAALLFIPVTGALWSEYTWLALACAVVVPAVSLGFKSLTRLPDSPRAARWIAVLGALAVLAAGLSISAIARPRLLTSLWFEVSRFMGIGEAGRVVRTVRELQPIYYGKYPGWESGLESVFDQIGAIWIFALPMLAWVLWEALRKRRPALRLLAVWSLVMSLGALIQLRMLVYFVPVAAVLAGAACARMTAWKRPVYRRAALVALIALVIAVNLPGAIRQLHSDGSPGADWQKAFLWLRQNSPEPFSDARAWWQYHARLGRAANPPELPRWGVAVWENGWAVEFIAHRVPMSNGTQSGDNDLARFYLETSPESAVNWLRKAGARYVMVDPQMPLGDPNSIFFPSAAQILGRDLRDYFRVMVQANRAIVWNVPVYLPAYYRSMAARLYLFDGAEVPGTGPWLFETQPTTTTRGTPVELIKWSQHFASEREAYAYMRANPAVKLTMGCLDPRVSCFPIPAVEGLRRVFTSDPHPVSPEDPQHAVKIFEVLGEQPQPLPAK